MLKSSFSGLKVSHSAQAAGCGCSAGVSVFAGADGVLESGLVVDFCAKVGNEAAVRNSTATAKCERRKFMSSTSQFLRFEFYELSGPRISDSSRDDRACQENGEEGSGQYAGAVGRGRKESFSSCHLTVVSFQVNFRQLLMSHLLFSG